MRPSANTKRYAIARIGLSYLNARTGYRNLTNAICYFNPDASADKNVAPNPDVNANKNTAPNTNTNADKNIASNTNYYLNTNTN